jgi:hypothetical protein
MPYERFEVTMAQNLKTLVSKPFAMTWVLNTSSLVRIHLPKTVWWKGKNQTLCEMAQMMLDGDRTPRRFWDEAVNTACHVSNMI